MKKILIMLFFTAIVLSSCNKIVHQVTNETWFTQLYDKGVYEGDSIYLEAGITFLTFTQDNFFEPTGTVELIGKGNVIYFINNDEFGLVSKEGKKMPAVIESFSGFKAKGTWAAAADDKVTINWNNDSTVVDDDLGKCINLNENDGSLFMLKYGGIVAKRSAECHSQALKIVNDWLKQRSELTYDANANKWNATIDGQTKLVMSVISKK